MDVTPSLTPVDQAVEEAAKERPGLPIRIRIQPAVLRKSEGKTANFQSWRNLHWMVSVADVMEAKQLREALSAFFFIASQRGVSTVHQALLSMIAPEGVTTGK